MYNFAELTQQQKNAIAAIVDKYADVEGSYESTMLQGIVHGYCDSGILTDCYSVECAERVSKYFTEDAQDEGHIFAFSAFIAELEGEELLCVKVIKELESITGCAETAAAYIGRITDTLVDSCYTD